MATDRNGNPLQKGDIVLLEMVVGDIFINAPAEREVLLTREEEGAPSLSVYTSAVHISKKDEQEHEAAATASVSGGKVTVTAPGAPKNRDGTLNTKGATENSEGNWEYRDGTVRRPDGSVV
jgi:hypothetical protein